MSYTYWLSAHSFMNVYAEHQVIMCMQKLSWLQPSNLQRTFVKNSKKLPFFCLEGVRKNGPKKYRLAPKNVLDYIYCDLPTPKHPK
jgi:hypothetical protein